MVAPDIAGLKTALFAWTSLLINVARGKLFGPGSHTRCRNILSGNPVSSRTILTCRLSYV
jgi:hypothetical protein